MAQTNVTSPRTKPTNSHSIPEKEAQLVTLKVNRIYRPSFALEDVVTHEKSDLTSASLLYRSSSRFANAQITSTGVNNLCLSPMLIVPIYNGDISLGEVFSCYISIYNHSEQSVQNVALKVELQTQTQKVTAFDSMHSEQQTNTQVLQPGSTADFIVRHAVWELGTHIMICNVSYQKHSGEKKQLKKFFKFQVTNSLTFDYKVALTQGEFIVESTLTNVTKGPLYIESAEFLAEEYFNVLELNPNQNTLNLPPSVSKSVGPLVYIQSGDARKFAFKLIYRNPFDPNIINSNVLGRFRFQWKSSFGDPASLTTEPITINFTQDRSVGLVVTELPSNVILEQPFSVTLGIVNRSDRPIQPSLSVLKHKLSGLVLMDNYEQVLETIPPKNHLMVTMSLLPLKVGIQKFPLLRIRDALTDKVYEFTNVFRVIVTTPDDNTNRSIKYNEE